MINPRKLSTLTCFVYFVSLIIRATLMGRPISSAAIHLGRRGHKSQPNVPTQTDTHLLFVRGLPIPDLFLSRICVGADTRRTRVLALSPSGPAGRWHIGLPSRPSQQQPSPASFVADATAHFLPATLPAAAAHSPVARHCRFAAAAPLTAQPPATKKPPRRPSQI